MATTKKKKTIRATGATSTTATADTSTPTGKVALPSEIVVINRQAAVFGISHTFNKPGSHSLSESTGRIMLRPGVNLLVGEQAEIWHAERNTDEIEAKLERRELVVATNREGHPLQTNPANLGELDLTMAEAFIQGTTSVSLLEAWLRQEKRAELKPVIQEQLEVMRRFDEDAERARAANA
jgi:hypothetical protein